MNGYDLTRNWFNFKFENQDKVKAIHTDFYIYLVDQWNRLGQKSNFGLPTSMTMQVLGIGSYNTYKKVLEELISFGFIILVKESKNQHQSKLIALSKTDKALDKALDKATIKATDEPTDKAIDTIDKQLNNYNNLTTEQQNNILAFANNLSSFELKKFLDSMKKEDKPERFSFKSELIKYGFQENLVDDWITVRKAKKASNTETAFKAFISEIEQRTCNINEMLFIAVTNSWGGFKYAWVDNLNENKFNTKKQSNEKLNIITTEIRNYDPTI